MSNETRFCGKCGSSLKNNIRFCTNCGVEINEEQIKRTTRDEFLNRYHGTKILDHISEMIDSNIGDRQRLEAIHHLLESRQDLDYVNFYYLKECSDKYNSIVRPKEKETIQSVPKKKGLSSKYKIIGIVVLVVFVSIIVIGASVDISSSNSNKKESTDIVKKETIKPKTVVKSFQDNGDFIPNYNPVKNSQLKGLEEGFKEIKYLETFTDKLNSRFKLPYDVPVIMTECGTPNAYYNQKNKEIIFCYELVAYYFILFKNLGYEDYSKRSAEVFTFVAYHELGHALIDVYELPITGMEEDAVDQLASLIFSQNKVGRNALETTIVWFGIESIKDDLSERLVFWDEHSLNQQRFYNILCWTYGSSPQEYSDVVNSDTLPKERASKCIEEYEKMHKTWKTLLDPHVTPGFLED